MRAEKKLISEEYLNRLQSSPFFIVAEYHGLKVSQFNELRNRLRGVNSEIHVVKNNIFREAAKEIGIELEDLSGQLAVVTGETDVPAAAKVLKNFQSEFEKPNFRFGYVDSERYEADDLSKLADLPPLDVLRGQLLGTLQAPARNLARLLNEPASRMARVLQAKADQG